MCGVFFLEIQLLNFTSTPLTPPPESDLIGLGNGLGIRIFTTSPKLFQCVASVENNWLRREIKV